MKIVTKKEFFDAIGKIDCHPVIVGKYPYTSEFRTPSRKLVGKIEPINGGAYNGGEDRYLLPDED